MKKFYFSPGDTGLRSGTPQLAELTLVYAGINGFQNARAMALMGQTCFYTQLQLAVNQKAPDQFKRPLAADDAGARNNMVR